MKLTYKPIVILIMILYDYLDDYHTDCSDECWKIIP